MSPMQIDPNSPWAGFAGGEVKRDQAEAFGRAILRRSGKRERVSFFRKNGGASELANRLARVDVPMHVQFVNPLQDSGILFADQFDIKEKKSITLCVWKAAISPGSLRITLKFPYLRAGELRPNRH